MLVKYQKYIRKEKRKGFCTIYYHIYEYIKLHLQTFPTYEKTPFLHVAKWKQNFAGNKHSAE